MPISTVRAALARSGFQRRGEKNIFHRQETPLDAVGRQWTKPLEGTVFGTLAQRNPLPILSASTLKKWF